MEKKVTITVQINQKTKDILERASQMFKKDLQEMYSEGIEEYANVFTETLKLFKHLAPTKEK